LLGDVDGVELEHEVGDDDAQAQPATCAAMNSAACAWSRYPARVRRA
jgi:hypothetical protein